MKRDTILIPDQMLAAAARDEDFAQEVADLIWSLWCAGYATGRVAGIDAVATNQLTAGEIEQARQEAAAVTAEVAPMIEAARRGLILVAGDEKPH
jgi:hypothetical protein